MSARSILKVNHISKYYSGVKALDDVSFEIQEGEMHALCGENGAGKSTLIKILTGAIRPTSGNFEFDGATYTEMNPGKAMEAGIRAIYQEFTLVPYLSVADNLFFGREPVKGIIRDRKKAEEETRKLCESIGISIDPKAKVESLGIAQQQIVEILKAVSNKAKFFIMDEPTAPLTVNETETFFKIIRQLKENGATIIFISHRLEEVFELCDRVTVFCDGKFVVTKDVKDVDRKQLISYMVGRELADTYPEGDMASEENILEVKGLTNSKLKDVSFYLKKGEVLGFGGLVGAGRTEMARALFGADPVKKGELILKGKPYSPKNPSNALAHGIGLIPEDRKTQGLIMEMSVEGNTTISILKQMVTNLISLNKKKEHECSRKYIEELKIKTPSAGQLVKNLSGGNQQKVVLAKMMAADCDVLIFDEPTRGIDVGAKQEIYTLMREITSKGKSIIMISSDMPELIGMSDRIIVMSNGSVSGELNRGEFAQETILEYASSKV